MFVKTGKLILSWTPLTAFENAKRLMTDEQTPDPSSSNPEDPSPLGEFDSADDLDRILAEAASLVSDISQEVGESASDSDDSVHAALDSDHVGDVAAQLDAELAALENLVSSTSDELGTGAEETNAASEATGEVATPEDTSAPAGPPDIDAASTGGSTESQDSANKMTPSAAATPTAESEPAAQSGVKSKTAVGEIPKEPQAAKDATPSVKIQSPRPGVVGTAMFGTGMEEQEEEDFEEEEQPPKPRWVQILDEKIAPTALVVCNRGAKMLDMVDHRIGGKVNEQMKQMIGLAALATLGTAFMVYILSFFWTP